MYGKGISREGTILDVGVDAGIIDKSGAWYSYNEHRLGQGRENSKDFLKENEEISREIELKIRDVYGLVKHEHEDKVEEGKDKTEE